MKREFDETIGRNIRERRIAKGWSLHTLGKILKVSYQQVQKYEKGTNHIAANKLPVLAKVFGCTVDELCGLEKTKVDRITSELAQHFSRIESAEMRKKILELVAECSAPLGRENETLNSCS